MACAILLIIVLAVSSAISAGQQHAFEAQQRIAGTLAAEELLGRLIAKPYADLASWHGYSEPVGTMTDVAGDPMPENFVQVGRSVAVNSELKVFGELEIKVRGRDVQVQSFDSTGRVLAQLSRFVPEPMP